MVKVSGLGPSNRQHTQRRGRGRWWSLAIGILLISGIAQCGDSEPDSPESTSAISEQSDESAEPAPESAKPAPDPRVPEVVGRSEAQAVRRLERAGFVVRVKTKTRTSGEDGVVLRQVPAGKDRASAGSKVKIVVASVIRPIAQPTENCTAGYKPCLPPASDYDCAGGSGDGPEYASGPIYVSGSDPYDLDSEGDGFACES